jgi:tetratricopeptide (TPR) repeat protein
MARDAFMSETNDAFYQTVTGLLQSGQSEEAVSQLESFLKSNVDDEVALSIYGSALMRAGKVPEAIDTFKRAVAIHPDSAASHADLAFISMKTGDRDQAIASFESTVNLEPAHYQAWVFLEKLYFEAGNFRAALVAVEKSEKLDPMDAEYRQMQSLMRAENLAGAEQIARAMLAKQQGHPRAAFFLAHLASTVGAHEERASILNHGLAHHPANISLRRALVQAYEEVGNYRQALEQSELLVTIRPDYLNYWTLSRVYGHIGDHEKSLRSAEQAAGFLKGNTEELGKVDLLRGHALKILGRREESEAAYRASIVHTPLNGAAWWGLADLKTYLFSETDREAMQSLATKEGESMDQRCQAAFALAKAYDNDNDAEQAFHWYLKANELRPDIEFSPAVHGKFCSEITTVFDEPMLGRQAQPEPEGARPIFIVGMPRSGSTLIEQILASHSQIEGTMELTTLPNLERKIRLAGGQKFKRDYPHSLADFSENELAEFGQAYLDKSAIHRTDKSFFIDKLPPNFTRVGLIHKILPNAVIIDSRRHPLDCGVSAFKQHFAGGHEYSYDLAHIAHYYKAYLHLMDHWDTVLPGRVFLVQYENMVRDTEFQVKAILDHIGVDFEPACLRFFDNKRAVKTASSEQVRQPIYTGSIGQWRKVSPFLAPLLHGLGDETLARFKELMVD